MPNNWTGSAIHYVVTTSNSVYDNFTAMTTGSPIVPNDLVAYQPPPKIEPTTVLTGKPTAVLAAVGAKGLPLGSEVLVYYKRSRVPGNYNETHRHQGETLYQNVQDLLARFFITVHYNSGPIPNWREWCIGATSTIHRDNLGQRLNELIHMPMFDYDGKNIKAILRKDVQYLQKEWGLRPATIFQTKKGFHVYFMTDAVSWASYHTMLSEVRCCEGFKRSAMKNGYGVLRVSAKYSTFDIKLYSVMQPEKAKALPARKLRKARVIEAILALGEKCGTHIASLCPEWAHYREDETPWKQSTKPKGSLGKGAPGKPGDPEASAKPVAKAMIDNQPILGDQPKQKLILKPRKLVEQMLEPNISNKRAPAFGGAVNMDKFYTRSNPCKEVLLPKPIPVNSPDLSLDKIREKYMRMEQEAREYDLKKSDMFREIFSYPMPQDKKTT